MAGLGSGDTSGMMTGDRHVTLTFDHDEYALTRQAWSTRRMYSQVGPTAAADKAVDSYQAQNLYHWASGCWTLRPRELRPWRIQEKASPGVLSTTPVAAVDGTQQPMFRNASGTGFSSASDNATDGSDEFFRKTIEAGSSWNLGSVLSAPTIVTDLTGILSAPPVDLAQPKSTQPLDPILHITEEAGPNAPLYLRVQVPGSGLLGYYYLGTLHWAQYALLLCGDGMAELWEHTKKLGAGTATWQKRASFRYARPDLVAGNTHTIVIFPHVGPNLEKYISFASAQMDAPGLLQTSVRGMGSLGTATAGEYLWKWDELLTGSEDITHEVYDTGDDYGVSKYISTIGGPVWLTERRDLRLSWQVGHVHFEESGTLTDLSVSQPSPSGGVVSVALISQNRGGSALDYDVLDATDDSVWTTGDTPSPMRLKFDFSAPDADGLDTSLLWGYQLRRSASYTDMSPGAFTTSYSDLDLQQGTAQAADESGSATIIDDADAYPRLRNRGELSVRVSTTYTPPGDTEKTVKLFQGYAVRPGRKRIGQDDRQYSYPSAEWSEYECSFVGMWKRLTAEATTMKTAMKLADFSEDPTDSASPKRPWKVVDVIYYLLGAAGFPASMIETPSLDIRLNPGVAASGSDLYLDAQVSVGDTINKLARTYLGMFLVFAPNAGTRGKWKLIGAPTDTTPVIHFVRTPATPTGSSATFQLPMHLGGFDEATVPILRRPHSHVVAPECNHLWACSKVDAAGNTAIRFENHVYNGLSFQVPGWSLAPDPDSPHYCPGGEKLLMINDQSLWAGAGGKTGGYDATQRVIDYLLMRLFFYTCLARRVMTFDAPLLPIYDASESAWRLPRFYDVCTVGGETGWYVRSCSPRFTKDHLQMASYQVEQIVPYQPAVGG
jgi:hypothetical protein